MSAAASSERSISNASGRPGAVRKPVKTATFVSFANTGNDHEACRPLIAAASRTRTHDESAAMSHAITNVPRLSAALAVPNPVVSVPTLTASTKLCGRSPATTEVTARLASSSNVTVHRARGSPASYQSQTRFNTSERLASSSASNRRTSWIEECGVSRVPGSALVATDSVAISPIRAVRSARGSHCRAINTSTPAMRAA